MCVFGLGDGFVFLLVVILFFCVDEVWKNNRVSNFKK